MSVFNYIMRQLAVWLSGNALASINEVTLRRARIALGWVTVCGRVTVNHLGLGSTQPGHPSVGRHNEYQ